MRHFDSCSKYFHQFFMIYVSANGHYIPVMFCLLVDKPKQEYQRLFERIYSICMEIGYAWNLNEAIVDFEIVISNVLNEVFTTVKIID